ncbi:hypothetical protein [Corynebacterium auriscanis]|nr:hypothetical protein [Corynebacterium auriscanis]
MDPTLTAGFMSAVGSARSDMWHALMRGLTSDIRLVFTSVKRGTPSCGV